MRSQSLGFGRNSSTFGRVSLLSELAGRGDQLINMNLESECLTAAPLSWRPSGRGGACYRISPGVCEKSDEAVIGWSKERESASLREFFLSSSVVERSAVN